MTFDFPMPANRANARGHWRKHHRAMITYFAKLDLIVMFKGIPRPPPEPFQKVKATATLYVHNFMDQGNALNRLKWIEDWLVSRKYVVDDSPKYWSYTGIPTQQIDRKKQRIVIELEPVVEDDRGPERPEAA